MNSAVDIFREWFDRLTPNEKKEVRMYLYEQENRDGYFAGPTPFSQTHFCPTCRKPL
jgi:hypothetical protein